MDMRSRSRSRVRRMTSALMVAALGLCGAACDDSDSSGPDSATGPAASSTQPSEPSTGDTATTPADTQMSAPDVESTTSPTAVAPSVAEPTTRSGDVGITVFGVDDGLPRADLDAVVIGPDGAVWAGAGVIDGWSWARLEDGRFAEVAESPGWGSEFAAGLDRELWMFGPPFFANPGVQHFDGTDWSIDTEAGISFGVVDTGGMLYGFDVAREGVDSLEPAPMLFAAFDGVSWTHLPTPPGPVSDGAPNPAIAPDGAVWVRTDSGLAWFDGEAWTTTADLDPAAAEAFGHVVAGDFRLGVDGTAWMLYDDDEFGPAWLYLADGAVERRAIDVAGLGFNEECDAGDAEGRLPLSTDPSVALNDLATLLAGFAGDDQGRLWTATTCLGVTRTDPVTGEVTVFTTADGLPSLRFLDLAAHPDGSVWAATDSGLVRFTPVP